MRSDDHDVSRIGATDRAANQAKDADEDGFPVGGRTRPARRYLAIGELLDTLRPEFPDLTLSKIRFLEQQGLLEPERTPSGYRKFFSGQVERLWWILDQQREGYVPLKEIKQRLVAAEAAGTLAPLEEVSVPAPDTQASVHRLASKQSARTEGQSLSVGPKSTSSHDDAHHHESDHDDGPDRDDEPDHDDGPDHDTHDPSLLNAPKEALGESRHPSTMARRVQRAFAEMAATTVPHDQKSHGAKTVEFEAGSARVAISKSSPSSESKTVTRLVRPAAEIEPNPVIERFGATNPLLGQNSGASFTFDELVRASGLEPDEVRELESFGLLVGHHVLGATYYDEDALIVVRAAHGFKGFGIEPRHMRIYRVMADRESGFLEQIVSPLVHRRQEGARVVAADQLEELIALGTQLRLVALRRLLRASLDSR